MEEVVEMAEVAEEVEVVDYLLWWDQAYFHRTDEPLILISSWAVNQKHLQEIGRKSSPSSLSGSYTVGSTQIMWQSKTSIKKPCYS
jgi:hypothetical protein